MRANSSGPRAARGIALVVGMAVALLPATSFAGVGDLLGGTVDATTSTLDRTVDATTSTVSGDGSLLDGDALDGAWLLEPDATTTMSHVNDVIRARSAWSAGYTGRGVQVALVDTGVVPVQGLTTGRVVNGPDVSFESQAESLRYLDTFGHGTHMAGIIAGNDGSGFRGVAPGAGLVSLKLAPADGSTDVSQVTAAVDWVVQHRNDPGFNIRVINLSYGTNGVQDYRVDPLAHAVESAWRHGVVVVVAAGNDGDNGAPLNNPALDPYVIAVGAADTEGTTTLLDDTVTDFSSRGDSRRRVDLVAPGRSIVSLRDPNSSVDARYPGARVGDRFFKGSGTSQAAAVVSGAAAILLQQRPGLTPDQVKALLLGTADTLPLADGAGQGRGMLDLYGALRAATPPATQTWARSTGLGSIESSRGDAHVADGGVALTGEHHILGPWRGDRWASASAAGRAWRGGSWHGAELSGSCWCGTSWTAATWGSAAWHGDSWAGVDWSGRMWHDETWTGRMWHGSGWTGRMWHDASWTGRMWHGSGGGPSEAGSR